MNSTRFFALPLLLAFVSAPATAQTAPSSSVPGKSGPVVTDVAPAPPEDRGSTGAIVLEQSPVKAKRDAQAEAGKDDPAAPTRRLGSGAVTPGALDELGRNGDQPGASPPAEGARSR